jgi:TRAP-type C4-dicarboxylate transport system permease small subunit
MRKLKRRFEGLLAGVCILLMVGLAVLIIVGVTLRKFGAPLGWYDEVAAIMLAWITYYGAAYAALRRAHLGFPNVVAKLRPPLRVAFVLLRQGLVIGFFGLVGWFGWRVIVVLQGDTLVSLPWVPVSLTQSVIPIGALLFILAELVTIPERLAEARSGGAPTDPERAIAEHKPA